MKKTKFLALTLVVALALIGAGYAYWTDVLQINSTVKTGYLDVDFIDAQHETSSEWVEVIDNYKTALGDGNEAGYTPDKDKIVLTIKNLYPGAWVKETVTIQNTGTMPVKVSEMVITSIDVDGEDDTILDYMIVTDEDGNEIEFDGNTATVVLSGGGELNRPQPNPPGPNPPGPNPPGPNPQPTPTEPLILEPEETKTYTIIFKLDESAPDNTTEFQKVTYEITINCKQYNEE